MTVVTLRMVRSGECWVDCVVGYAGVCLCLPIKSITIVQSGLYEAQQVR